MLTQQTDHVEEGHALKQENSQAIVTAISSAGGSNSSPTANHKYALGEFESFREYLDTLDFGPGQRDYSGINAFLRAGSLGISGSDAIREVSNHIKATGGTFTPSKLVSQLRRAYEYVGSPGDGMRAIIKPPKAKFNQEKLKQCASKVIGINPQWLREHSPVAVEGITSALFLEHLYQPGERIVVFTTFESQGQCIYKVGCRYNTPLPKGGQDGVWFLANPVDGEYHPNPRQENKLSRRSEESVISWRYLVLESDVADQNEWLSCLGQFPLRIVAVYTSGGKSIHALVRLDAVSKQDWDAKKEAIKNAVVTLGADEHALTAVRLSRLPATMRGERPQELLYLNPKADGTSIIGKGK